MFTRVWHATVAGLVLAALILQVWIAIRVPGSPPSHAVGRLAGTAPGWRIARVFSFFTIESNTLAALGAWLLALNPARDGRGWRVLRLDSLVGITVTGLVYGTVLSKVHEPHGWQETSTNIVLHYAVPILMVVGWLVFGPRPRITAGVVGSALIWPALYLLYILIQGWFSKWYPYPFLDVISDGYGPVLLNAVAVLVALTLVTVLFWWGDRVLPAGPGRHGTAGGGPAAENVATR